MAPPRKLGPSSGTTDLLVQPGHDSVAGFNLGDGKL